MTRRVRFKDGPAANGGATIYKPAGQPWPTQLNVRVMGNRKDDPTKTKIPMIACYQRVTNEWWSFVGFVEATALPPGEAMMHVDLATKTVTITDNKGTTTTPVPFVPDRLAPNVMDFAEHARLAAEAIRRGWGRKRP